MYCSSDPPAPAKSMLAKHAAEALGLPFQALSLGPTTPMSKVFGYFDAHGHYHDTPFRRAFEHGGVMLLDELDNGHPGLLGELNQALAPRARAFADGMVTAHDDFRLVATANTYGTGGDRQYVGRQVLDAATLDRFVMIDVPIDPLLEQRIVPAEVSAPYVFPYLRADDQQWHDLDTALAWCHEMFADLGLIQRQGVG
jgi:cobaltochelatase CobS